MNQQKNRRAGAVWMLLWSAMLCIWCAAPARAQEVAAPSKTSPSSATAQQRPFTEAELKAQYESCPGGSYSGPRPGKARYAKDPWLWVVTPEFAKRFCMPPEFISNDLKGAQAVAFRVLTKSDDENCGFGGNPSACSAETVLRFDLYIPSDAKLPKAHEGRYYQGSLLPSAMLISNSAREWAFLREQTKRKPELALKPHFDGQQVGIEGIKDGKVAWPIVSLFQQTHFGGIFEGIDYYAFEGSTGFFENPGIKQNNVTRFFITFARTDRNKSQPRTGQLVADRAHVIELPEDFTNKVSELDQSRGRNIRALMREAFKPVGASSTPPAQPKP